MEAAADAEEAEVVVAVERAEVVAGADSGSDGDIGGAEFVVHLLK